jgi:hypothetical protein
MPYTAETLYPSAAAGEGANNDKLQDAEPATLGHGGVDWGTTATDRWIAYKPGVVGNTLPAQAADPNGVAANDAGFNVLKADMNGTGPRFVKAGTVTVLIRVNSLNTDLVNAVYRVGINVYLRSAVGAYAHKAWATSAAVLMGATNQFSIPLTYPEIVFATDETLHVELWIKGRGLAVTGRTCSVHIGPSGAPDNFRTLVPVVALGIRTRFGRAPAAESAPAADSVARTAAFPRGVSESAPAADAPARSYVGARGISDSAPAVDAVARVAMFPRGVSESAPA